MSVFSSLGERAAVLLTGTGHVREDDVDVDFQFVSSRRVDVQLRMNLRGNTSVNATQDCPNVKQMKVIFCCVLDTLGANRLGCLGTGGVSQKQKLLVLYIHQT